MSAMNITFTCPHCGEDTLIEEKYVGQSGECRACGRMVTVTSIVAPRDGSRSDVPQRVARGCWYYAKLVAIAIVCLFVVTLCVLPNIRYAGPAARRMSSGNNLKQIGLAMLNYHDLHGKFPRAYHVLPSGERTMSWRVAILPHVEQESLFHRYRSDEPWNSQANLEVAKERVPQYQNPSNKDRDSRETYYMVITGPGTMFEEGKDFSFDDCRDGTANTILAVEVKATGVNWAQPVDLDIRNMIFKLNGGAFGISSDSPGGAQVVFVDGHVRFLSNDTLESTLRAMITRSGGEDVHDHDHGQ